MSKLARAGSLGSTRALCGLLVATLLAVALAPGQPAAAQDCPGDIGCLECKLRWPPGALEPFFLCLFVDYNAACACFTWMQGGSEICQVYGYCRYDGWQGGDPPRV